MRRVLPDYDELEVRLTPGRHDAYNVEIESASGARGHGWFSAPADVDVERFRQTVDPRNRRVRGRSRYLEAATRFGTRLFEELISSAGVRDVYTTARHEATAAGRGLRVTLSLRGAPELASIPWEFLYDRPRFLAQHVTSPVVRFIDLENPPPPLHIQPPLRVLGMVSRPRGDELATLDVEQEQAALERRLAPLIDSGAVTLRWLPRATLSALQQEVDHGDEFHIFHYIGHGEYDEDTGHSSLILESPDRRPRRVNGQQLGALLSDRGSLRLAVLNACEAAQTAPQDPLAGIATSLMEYGVPAVVAMQFAITDEGALTFADEFYGALADGYAVDAAVTQGRRALAADSDVEWGTPVLFVRVLDGHLFELDHPDPAMTPGTVRGPTPRDEPHPPALPAREPEPIPVPLPTTSAEPRSLPGARTQRRRVIAGVLGVVALAVVGLVLALALGGGSAGSNGSSATQISINPSPDPDLKPIHGLTAVETRETDAPGGYRYRLILSKVTPPHGASPSAPVSYYFTLSVRRGSGGFVLVDRMELPYRFTADSAIADFSVYPNPSGTASATLSWFVTRGDKEDDTHYFDLSPAEIALA